MRISHAKSFIIGYGAIVCLLIFLPAAAVKADLIQADVTPWSGYWWPTTKGGLATGLDYRGRPAPLDKYLYLTGESTARSLLLDWYRNRYYDPYAPRWHGLCVPWSRAAIMENYPILPSSHDNIVFRVGDKKGLLTLCHDGDSFIRDIGSNPRTFHFWLLEYIGRQGKAFTADLDPGEEVWYYPIYAYEMASVRQGMNQDVTVTISYVSDNVKPDFMGTRTRRNTYTYTLTLNADGAITGGWWTGSSVNDHPDTLTMPVGSAALCPYIDCDVVRTIARSQDDFLELPGNQPHTISPGTYHLVLQNEDRYIMVGQAGDEAHVIIEKKDGSSEDITISIFNRFDAPVMTRTLSSPESAGYRLIMQDPPYTAVLSQEDFSDPNIYTLTVDFLRAYRQNVSHIPKQGQWIGFSLTNTGSRTVENVVLVSGTPEGSPIQTLLGPMDLLAGEKQIFSFDDLPVRKHEYADTESLVLISSDPVAMVNLFAPDQGPMAGFGPDERFARRLVIPDIYFNAMSTPNFMRAALTNESFTTAPVSFRLYAADGTRVSEVNDEILPGGRYPFNPGTAPFADAPDGGWLDVSTAHGISLSGYQYVRKIGGNNNVVETLFALPVSAGEKIVPHITAPIGRWTTILTLINPNNRDNRVRLHPARNGNRTADDLNLEMAPNEKRVIDLSEAFGQTEGEPLYRSILYITGDHPIAGHYAYSPANGGDEAAFPLIDSSALRSELFLPHYAGRSEGWWTGVGICNPGVQPVEIFVMPFDNQGREMTEFQQLLELPVGAYDVFDVRTMFGNAVAADIVYVKFYTDDPEHEIGGFYLYGSANNNNQSGFFVSLSGFNM